MIEIIIYQRKLTRFGRFLKNLLKIIFLTLVIFFILWIGRHTAAYFFYK